MERCGWVSLFFFVGYLLFILVVLMDPKNDKKTCLFILIFAGPIQI